MSNLEYPPKGLTILKLGELPSVNDQPSYIPKGAAIKIINNELYVNEMPYPKFLATLGREVPPKSEKKNTDAIIIA